MVQADRLGEVNKGSKRAFEGGTGLADETSIARQSIQGTIVV